MCEALGRTRESFLSLLRHEPMDCISQRLLQAEKDPVPETGKGVSYGFYRGLQNLGKSGKSQQEVAQGQGARFLMGDGRKWSWVGTSLHRLRVNFGFTLCELGNHAEVTGCL